MSEATEARPKRAHLARLASITVIVIGAAFIAAGATAWIVVSDTLRAEGITVSDDARFFAGEPVAGPFTAFAQADIIATHALDSADGQSYAQLDRDDPRREAAMNAAFLRASLFTSVISFGIALFAVGVGVVSLLLGWVSLALLRTRAAAARSDTAKLAQLAQETRTTQVEQPA